MRAELRSRLVAKIIGVVSILLLTGCAGANEATEKTSEETSPVDVQPLRQTAEASFQEKQQATACDTGWQECSGLCTEIASDPKNCGACQNNCASGFECKGGLCLELDPCVGGICQCLEPESECEGRCVDLTSDSVNCGTCGSVCPAVSNCNAGTCSCESDDESLCGESCINLQENFKNCGECGNSCQGEEQCFEGSCGCPEGAIACDGVCIDESEDPEHCGACDNACERYEECSQGACLYIDDPDECLDAPLHIKLSRVSIYQGVEVDLFNDDDVVNLEDQDRSIIAQRRALVRLFTKPEATYEGQTLSGRVYVKNADVTEIFYDKKEVSSVESAAEQLDSTLNIELPADTLNPDTEIWAKLVACEPQGEGQPEAIRSPRASDSSIALAARETGIIKVAFIPFNHDGFVPDTSPATISKYVEEIEKLYPTTGVQASVLPELDSGQTGSIDLTDLLIKTQDEFGKETTEDDLYFYGLVDPDSSFSSYCNSSCTTGIGYVSQANNSRYRVAVGIGFGTVGVATFAHELGHNHGRAHAPCGGASDVDQSYPSAYTSGNIGVRGYDLFAQELKEATTHRDHMGYCAPDWISDYGFNLYADRIAAVNSVAISAFQRNQFVAADVTWQRIVVSPESARWHAPQVDSARPSDMRTSVIVYDRSGAAMASVEAFQINIGDSDEYLLLVPPNEPEWFALGLPNGSILAY